VAAASSPRKKCFAVGFNLCTGFGKNALFISYCVRVAIIFYFGCDMCWVWFFATRIGSNIATVDPCGAS
jgi:hypothetical protein